MKTSLICSTYNSPRYLALVLESMLLQTTHDFECLIADDGSGEETKQLIESYKKRAPFPIHHIWHTKPKGEVQKAKIHNVAIQKAQGELLIFIDGDCVLGQRFISDHIDIWQKESFDRNQDNYIFMGRRVELGEDFSSRLTVSNLHKKVLSGITIEQIASAARGDSRSILRRYRLKNPLLRKMIRANNVKDLLGCNFSISKELMLKVNGFDEECRRYGGEDGDLFIRVRNSGAKLIGMKYFAPQFHVWHKRSYLTEAQEKLYDRLLKIHDYTWTENGIIKERRNGSLDPAIITH